MGAHTPPRTPASRSGKYNFSRLVWCNIGNSQQLGQKPITFFRQVLAICDYPEVRGAARGPRPPPLDVMARFRGPPPVASRSSRERLAAAASRAGVARPPSRRREGCDVESATPFVLGPQLLDMPGVAEQFPSDVVSRARLYLEGMGGTTGCYTDSRGALVLRRDIARGIERRDGYPADVNTIFMTDGATPCVHMALKMLLRDASDAVLTPIPQYPLYSACIELYGGSLVPYYLDEANGWTLDTEQLRKQVQEAEDEVTTEGWGRRARRHGAQRVAKRIVPRWVRVLMAGGVTRH